MKIRYCILLLFISLILMSSKDDEMLNTTEKLFENISRTIKKKYGLQVIGTGGSMMDNIDLLAIAISVDGGLSVEKGRVLIHNLANEFLNEIKGNKKIYEFLNKKPDDIALIEISLLNRRNNLVNEMSIIGLKNGVISYCVDKKSGGLELTLKEEY